jgi:hypothetical protein
LTVVLFDYTMVQKLVDILSVGLVEAVEVLVRPDRVVRLVALEQTVAQALLVQLAVLVHRV